MNKEVLIKEELREDLNRLDMAIKMLKYSLDLCKKIGIKVLIL